MRRRIIVTLAVREWRQALSARWLWIYAAATAGLGAGLLWMAAGMLPAGLPGATITGRVLVTTVNLFALLVPLMGLTAGAQCLARERDRRTLAYLLAQPVTRTEILLGKLTGNGVALAVALLAAVAVIVGAAWWLYLPLSGAVMWITAGLAWLLAMASLGLGAALGARSPGLASANGAVLAAWLLLVFVGDLALMGTVMQGQIPVQVLLALSFLNPVHQFRVAALVLLSPSLDVLGPVGLFMWGRLGTALAPVMALSLVTWTGAIVTVALERFRHSPAIST